MSQNKHFGCDELCDLERVSFMYEMGLHYRKPWKPQSLSLGLRLLAIFGELSYHLETS